MAKKRLNKIKEILDQKGISQYRVAEDTGISYKTINGYYHGKVEPSLENLKLIADKIGVSLKDLVN